MEIVHMSKFKPERVEKNSSTVGPPARIEPVRLCDAGVMPFCWAAGVVDKSKRNLCV